MSIYPNQQIKSLRKSGDIEKAYQLGHELLQQYPNDRYVKEEFGWVLYDKVKQIVANTNSHLNDEIRNLLGVYSKLELNRPDLLFSLLISCVLRLQDLPFFFPKFLTWAGIQSFRKEDLQRSKPDDQGNTFPSMIEKLANKVGKQVISDWKQYDSSVHNFTLTLIDLAIRNEQVKDVLWLRYRKGQILCELGHHDLAREELLFVLKKKQREFWAWHAFANNERVRSSSTALDLCIKAYLVAEDKKFVVGVLEDIVKLTIDSDESALAEWSLDKYISIRESQNWSIPEPIKSHLSSDWYLSADALEDPNQVLAKHAKSAESILFDEKSWQDANFVEFFETKREKKFAKLICQTSNHGLIEVSVPVKRFSDMIKLKKGSAIQVVIEPTESRYEILALKTRENGKLFDCLEKVEGILDHQNTSKRLASIYLSATGFCLLNYDKFKEVSKWEIGTPVILMCTQQDGKYRAYNAQKGIFRESQWISKKTGILQIHERGFGFVGDSFVPPSLVKKHLDGVEVTVVALRKPKKRNEPKVLGWQAVTLNDAC